MIDDSDTKLHKELADMWEVFADRCLIVMQLPTVGILVLLHGESHVRDAAVYLRGCAVAALVCFMFGTAACVMRAFHLWMARRNKR